MKILCFGATGQVATELARNVPLVGAGLEQLGRDRADLTDPAACAALVASTDADIIINAAAYTAEGDRATVQLVNADALLLIVQKGALAQSYNIGGENAASNLDLGTKVCAILDGNHPCAEQNTFRADCPGHDQRYAIDPSRIRKEPSWRPSVTIDEGPQKTVQWPLDHEDRWRASQDRDGVGQRRGAGS